MEAARVNIGLQEKNKVRKQAVKASTRFKTYLVELKTGDQIRNIIFRNSLRIKANSRKKK